MHCTESPRIQFDDFKYIFPRTSLQPKVIHLRKVSQEKHIKRMQSALQMKQQKEQDGIYSALSPSTPRHNSSTCFQTPNQRSTRKTENYFKLSESKKDKENARRYNCTFLNVKKDVNPKALLPNGELSKSTQTDNCNNLQVESKHNTILKAIDCKIMRDESQGANISGSEKESSLSSIYIKNKNFDYNINEKKCISLSENPSASRSMVNRIEDRTKFSSGSKMILEKKLESSPAQNSSNKNKIILLENPEDNNSDRKKNLRLSKIPVSLDRLRKLSVFKADVYSESPIEGKMSSGRNTKSEGSFFSNRVGNVFDFFMNNIQNKKQDTYAVNVKNDKFTLEKWEEKDDKADSSSSLYSCRSRKNVEMSPESSPDKDSSLSLRQKSSVSIDSCRKNILDTSDFVTPVNKTKISESWEFRLQNTNCKEDDNLPAVSDRENVLKSKKRGFESGEDFYDSYYDLDEKNDDSIFMYHEKKNVNDNDEWKSSDDADFSSASSSQYLLETMAVSPNTGCSNAVYDSRTVSQKPECYSTPYNLRYPRYKPGAYTNGHVQSIDNSRDRSSRSTKKYNSTPKWKRGIKPKRSKKKKSAPKKSNKQHR